jgi:putative SOS response-associated peptidase YedK
MCNLYNVTSNQQAILDFTRALTASVGNLKPSLDVYPDYAAPIVRAAANGGRELVLARWGMPSPPRYGTAPVTNIRNVKSPHWRRWLGVENRCVVPATRFCEWSGEKGEKRKVWFAVNANEPLFVFAGIWTAWHGVRKKAESEQDHELFGFLTCEPNDIVRPIHAKAMPVILTRQDEIDLWLSTPAPEALQLQRPLPDAELIILPEAA